MERIRMEESIGSLYPRNPVCYFIGWIYKKNTGPCVLSGVSELDLKKQENICIMNTGSLSL